MARNKPKGWVKEPVRHGLAAKGIRTAHGVVKFSPRALNLLWPYEKKLPLKRWREDPLEGDTWIKVWPVTNRRVIEAEIYRERGRYLWDIRLLQYNREWFVKDEVDGGDDTDFDAAKRNAAEAARKAVQRLVK